MGAHLAQDGVAARWQSRCADLRAAVEARIPPRFRRVISAEDVLQDAWLTITRGVPPDVRNVDAWIATVVENRLLDALRVHRALRRGGGLGRLSGLRGVWMNGPCNRPIERPSARVRRIEAVYALRSALKGLTPSTARVLHWRFFDELSLDEIERRTGRSKAAVRGVLYRAMRRLARGMRFWAGPSD